MLEQAIAPPDEEDRAIPRNKSGADILFRQKKQASNDALASTVGLPGQEEAVTTEKPDIPVWLATARARDTLTTVSSTPTMPQQSPQPPFSPYQNNYGQQQPGTPSVPPPAAPSLSYQPQYGQQYPMPMITDAAPRVTLPTYTQQHPGPPQSQVVPANTRQQLLSTTVRSSTWRPEGQSPSGQSSPRAPANFTQSPHPTQPFQYPTQPSGQPMQEQHPPSTSADFPQQPLSVHSSYQNQLPERSPLEQHSPDTQALVGSGHLPQNYWPQQPHTSFELPEMTPNHPTGRPPSMSLVYDQAQGTEASTTPPQLPFPVTAQSRSLLANVTPGYYVRAAGTLQKYPADFVHP